LYFKTTIIIITKNYIVKQQYCKVYLKACGGSKNPNAKNKSKFVKMIILQIVICGVKKSDTKRRGGVSEPVALISRKGEGIIVTTVISCKNEAIGIEG
jgi:hypothetical protein